MAIDHMLPDAGKHCGLLPRRAVLGTIVILGAEQDVPADRKHRAGYIRHTAVDDAVSDIDAETETD